VVVALQQHHTRTVARGRHGSGHARRPAAQDEHVALRVHGHFTRGLGDVAARYALPALALPGIDVGAKEIAFFGGEGSHRGLSRKRKVGVNE